MFPVVYVVNLLRDSVGTLGSLVHKREIILPVTS